MIWRVFWPHTSKLSLLSNKFEVWFLVYHRSTCDVLFVFSVWFFKMELNPLLDLLINGLTIIENLLFALWVPLWETNIAGPLPGFHWQDSDIYLIEKLFRFADVWKHFKYWLYSSNSCLNYWTYFPKNCRVNRKQVKMNITFLWLLHSGNT